jgi:hypothetical protein
VSVSSPDGSPSAEIDAAPDPDGRPDRPDARPPGMCTDGVTELISNGGFEEATQEGATGWTEDAADGDHLTFPEKQLGGFAVHEGNRCGWMGRATISDQRLSQVVLVPEQTTSLTLTFYRCFATGEDPKMVFDTMTVSLLDDGGAPLEPPLQFTNQDAGETCVWAQFEHPAGVYAGQEVELEFHVVTDNGTLTSFFLDAVSLAAEGPCPDGG